MRGIIFSPGDEMDMGMKDGLACRFSAIDTDIETLYRRVPAQDQGFKSFNQVMRIASFLTGHVKIVGTMAFREDKHMVGADGGAVLDGKCGLVFKDDTERLGLAERARTSLFVL
jgi:hypothetical protein